MANPRKFSEKIALHHQKQAEETAAFEAIMREVSGATRTVYQKHHLHISQNLGAYRGGSLPNVNQIGVNAGIDLQSALHNLEDMKQGRQSLADRIHRDRARQIPHRRAFPFDKRVDCSPYGSAYLSPPLDTNWRRMFRHLEGGAFFRTNSDSALHTSAMAAPMTDHVHGPTTPPTHRRAMDMVGDSIQADAMKAYWDPKKIDLVQSRPKSCEVPNINIYPSQDQDTNGGMHIPISNNTGSLPDLTSLHFPSPLSIPLDVEDQGSVVSAYQQQQQPPQQQHTPPGQSGNPNLSPNLSPTSIHHHPHLSAGMMAGTNQIAHHHQQQQHQQQQQPQQQQQSPVARRRHPHGGPSPLVLSSGNVTVSPNPMRLPLSPPASIVDPSHIAMDPRLRQQYILYIQQQQRLHHQQQQTMNQIPNKQENRQQQQSQKTVHNQSLSPAGHQHLSPTHPLACSSPDSNCLQAAGSPQHLHTLSPLSSPPPFPTQTHLSDAQYQTSPTHSLAHTSSEQQQRQPVSPSSPSSSEQQVQKNQQAPSQQSSAQTPLPHASPISPVQASAVAAASPQMVQIQLTSCPVPPTQPSLTQYRNSTSDTTCQSPTSPLSQPSYSPAQSPGLPPTQNNSAFADVYYLQQQQQTNALQHQFEQFNMLQDNHPVSTLTSPSSTTTNCITANGIFTGQNVTDISNAVSAAQQAHSNAIDISSAALSRNSTADILHNVNDYEAMKQFYSQQLDQSSPVSITPPHHLLSNSALSAAVAAAAGAQQQQQQQHHHHHHHQHNPQPGLSPSHLTAQHLAHLASQANNKIPDIILTGVDDPLSRQDFAKELGNAITGLTDSFDSDLFPSDEALKVGLDPLDLDGLQMLTDPSMVADPATEDTFRLDRL